MLGYCRLGDVKLLRRRCKIHMAAGRQERFDPKIQHSSSLLSFIITYFYRYINIYNFTFL